MITIGVATMSALGMTFCGFSISPASVLIDSQPEYIHIIIGQTEVHALDHAWP